MNEVRTVVKVKEYIKKKNDMIQNIWKVIWLHRKRSASKLVDIESYARRVVIANIIYFTLKTRIEEKIYYYTFLSGAHRAKHVR